MIESMCFTVTVKYNVTKSQSENRTEESREVILNTSVRECGGNSRSQSVRKSRSYKGRRTIVGTRRDRNFWF